MTLILFLLIVLIILNTSRAYYKGYLKGYNQAKDIYDETCDLKELL